MAANRKTITMRIINADISFAQNAGGATSMKESAKPYDTGGIKSTDTKGRKTDGQNV